MCAALLCSGGCSAACIAEWHWAIPLPLLQAACAVCPLGGRHSPSVGWTRSDQGSNNLLNARDCREALEDGAAIAAAWEKVSLAEGRAIYGAGMPQHVKAVCEWVASRPALSREVMAAQGSTVLARLPGLLADQIVAAAASLAWLRLVPEAAASGGIGDLDGALQEVRSPVCRCWLVPGVLRAGLCGSSMAPNTRAVTLIALQSKAAVPAVVPGLRDPSTL